MAIVTVYDPEGNAHEKESIDAIECVKECGWSLSPPEVAKEEVTRDEMKAFLIEKGVEFAVNIKQPALTELYNAEKAKG